MHCNRSFLVSPRKPVLFFARVDLCDRSLPSHGKISVLSRANVFSHTPISTTVFLPSIQRLTTASRIPDLGIGERHGGISHRLPTDQVGPKKNKKPRKTII